MIRSMFLTFSLCSSLINIGYAGPQQIAAPNKTQMQPKIFKSFTGKVTANKVRVRVKPDMDSHILRQINKNDLLLVVGEEGDFYAVAPPKDTKAYVFRSYIIDDIVEANRVNVRLEPHADAPIIGQLQNGMKVQSQVCSINHKWLEIPAPQDTHFYVSKEFLVSAGGPEYLSTMEKRKEQVDGLLNASYLMAETECRKPYEEISLAQVTEQFQTILRNFTDFPDAIAQAKEGLALLKETYLNKKIAFLESKAELSPFAKEELIAKHKEESKELFIDTSEQTKSALWNKRNQKKELTQSMHLWDTIEESLYLSWTAFHSGKKVDDFYAEQRANATIISGTLESYTNQIKDRPGNFILRNTDTPIAYVYSTHIDLEKYEGKTVSLIASPRPNNHFAFPAYFILGVE